MIAVGLPNTSRSIDTPPGFLSFELGHWDLFGH
jgi:hypothetical protein